MSVRQSIVLSGMFPACRECLERCATGDLWRVVSLLGRVSGGFSSLRSKLVHRRAAWIATTFLGVLSGCTHFDDGVREMPKVQLSTAFRNTITPQTKPADAKTGETEAPKADSGAPKADSGTPKAEAVTVAAPPMPDALTSDGPTTAVQAQLAAPDSKWWESFHSDELDRLIGMAMENNHDLKVAVARIAQAEDTAVINGAAEYPTLNLNTQLTGSRAEGGLATGNLGSGYARIPQISFQASYEADLWGKNKYSAESAYALAMASIHYREGVALTLASDITKTYVDVLADSDHVAVALNNLVNARKSLESVRTRMEQGDATQVELLQQETTASNAEATVQVHRLNREKAFNKLAALLGTTPSFLELSATTLKGIQPPDLSPGIPAQLLCRRPDIRRAEATLLSADADIKVARAKMYPDITFSASIGRSGYAYAEWLLPQANFLSVVGSLTQAIFSGGKNSATLHQTQARYEEMVQTYRQAIIQAVHDVEDALAEIRLTGEQRKALVKASGHARQAYEISTYSFDKHAIDFLSLLESQRSLYTTEDAEVSARADMLKASVDLFTALGGGLDAPHC